MVFGLGMRAPKISTRQIDDVMLVTLAGKISRSRGAPALREVLADLTNHGSRKMVLDLSTVTTMDAAGVDELRAAACNMSKQGGKLRLAALPPNITDLLLVLQVIGDFDVYDTQSEALASF